jgi:hypothetical protein
MGALQDLTSPFMPLDCSAVASWQDQPCGYCVAELLEVDGPTARRMRAEQKLPPPDILLDTKAGEPFWFPETLTNWLGIPPLTGSVFGSRIPAFLQEQREARHHSPLRQPADNLQ